MNWVFDPIGSLVGGIATNNWGGSIWALGTAANNFFKDLFKQDKGDDVGATEQIPAINGSKNTSGAGKVIPLLLGKTFYSPVYAAQTYTDIDPSDGSDGENQYYHALFCLGYNDIKLNSVSLGIYPLSTDEHDGTSGMLNVDNIASSVEKATISRYFSCSIQQQGDGTLYIRIPVTKDDCDISSLSNETVTISFSGAMHGLFMPIPIKLTVKSKSVSCNGNTGAITVVFNEKKSDFSGYFAMSCTGTYSVSAEYKRRKQPIHYKSSEYKQQLEFQQNGADVSLFPQKVIQENFGTELLYPQGAVPLVVQPFSAVYPQRIQLEIQLSNLIRYDDEGNKQTNELIIACGYSLDGGATYKPFNAFKQSSKEVSVTDEGTVDVSTVAEGTSGTARLTKFSGCKNKVMRFIAEKTFSFDEVFDGLKNNAVEFRIWRYTESVTESDSKYQYTAVFNSIRTWCYDYKETKKQYEKNGTKTLVPQKPIVDKYKAMTARLGFKIKAGGELSGTIDEVNVDIESRARYCTITANADGEKTYTWSSASDTRATNNPAALALMVLQHKSRGNYAYPDSAIDLDSFGRFYERCEETDSELDTFDGKRFVANGILSKETKTFDLVNQILAVGHGKLVLNGSKYAVMYDSRKSMPVMVLNNQNVLEASNSKAFDEDIDGYSVKFIDSLNQYQEDTIVCVPKNSTKPESEYVLENLELPWITDAKRVYREAMYRYACRKLRPETWTRKVGVDGNLLDIGSLVLLQDDTISVGIGEGAEITEVFFNSERAATGIRVDYPFTISDAGSDYGVRITVANGVSAVKVITCKIKNRGAGEYTVLEFSEPVPVTSTVPNVGDIVSFGLYEKITTPALCFGKKDNGDQTFSLTLVPYDEGVYDADDGIIPEFNSNVTAPTQSGVPVSSELPSATIDDLNTAIKDIQTNINNGGLSVLPQNLKSLSAVAEKDGIMLSAETQGNTLADSVDSVIYQISRDAGNTWAELDRHQTDYLYRFDRETDGFPEADGLATYRFRAKAVNVYGNLSNDWVVCNIDVSSYGTWIPYPILNVIAVPDRDGIRTSWETDTSGRIFYGTSVAEIKTSHGETEKTGQSRGSEYLYRFDRSADGFPEREDFNEWSVGVRILCVETGIKSDKTEAAIDVSAYGTWIPTVRNNTDITLSAMKRTVTLYMSQPVSRNVYGQILYGIRIRRKNSDDGWYTPDNTADYRASEDSFYQKDEDGNPLTDPAFATSEYSITLPLAGQNNRVYKLVEHDVYTYRDTAEGTSDRNYSTQYAAEYAGLRDNLGIYGDGWSGTIAEKAGGVQEGSPVEWQKTHIYSAAESDIYSQRDSRYTLSYEEMPSPEATPYQFKLSARNETTGVTFDDDGFNLVMEARAEANSVYDVVDGTITNNKLSDDAVTADKIAAGTITAELIAAENILAKGAKAGMVETDGLKLGNSGFWASEPMTYRYNDPGDGNKEKTYSARKGEFLVGNTPDTAAENEVYEYLHYKPGDGFWMRIKNFIIRGLATLIQGVFAVKKPGAADKDSFFAVNPTDSTDSVTNTPAKTARVAGDIMLKGNIISAGTKANYPVIRIKDNTSDAYGNGIVIGGGGATVMGAGESAENYYSGAKMSAGDETTIITSDEGIIFASNMQNGFNARKEMVMNTDGRLSNPQGFVGPLSGNADTATRATGIPYTGEQDSCISAVQQSGSFNNSENSWASYIICNHGNGKTYYNQMLRLNFFKDEIKFQRRENGKLKGWKTLAMLENANTWTENQVFNQATIGGQTITSISVSGSTLTIT